MNSRKYVKRYYGKIVKHSNNGMIDLLRKKYNYSLGCSGLIAGYKVATETTTNGNTYNVWVFVCPSQLNIYAAYMKNFYDATRSRNEMRIGDRIYIVPKSNSKFSECLEFVLEKEEDITSTNIYIWPEG